MNTALPDEGETLLKLRDVERITTLGKSTIYRKINSGAFPRPRRAGENCQRWLRSEVMAWIQQLPTDSPSA
jgi:prophage regulatory protein